MRFFMRATTLALAVLAVPMLDAAAQQAAPKIAYVNSQALMNAAPGRQEAEDRFQREMQGYQQQVQRMRDSLQAMLATYQQQQATLTDSARTARQLAIRTREQEYTQRDQQLQQQMAERQQELVQPIMDMVRRALDEIRAEGGYAMIFDTGSEVNVIVAADKNLDITERVIAKLRTMKPAAASTTPAQPQQTRPAGATTPPPAGVRRPPPQR